MTKDHLQIKLTEAATAVQGYVDSLEAQGMAAVLPPDRELHATANRLVDALYVLLPPRGPATSVDCPHCGNPVNITLSK